MNNQSPINEEEDGFLILNPKRWQEWEWELIWQEI
jgi:hypothetical protein